MVAAWRVPAVRPAERPEREAARPGERVAYQVEQRHDREEPDDEHAPSDDQRAGGQQAP
jgi:hypothetical protein